MAELPKLSLLKLGFFIWLVLTYRALGIVQFLAMHHALCAMLFLSGKDGVRELKA
jgi:hypothetical protein